MKPHLYMDAEVYPNFAMVGLQLPEQVLAFTTEPGLGEPFNAFRDWCAQHRCEFLWVGFNSLEYDNHLVGRILDGVDDPAALYELSGTLIDNDHPGKRNILAHLIHRIAGIR